MPQKFDSLLQVFVADGFPGVRVDRETEPECPENPPTYDVYVWADSTVQQCPDGTSRHATRPDHLRSLTRDEAEALVRTLREALDYRDDRKAADVHCPNCGGGGCPECDADVIPFPVVP